MKKRTYSFLFLFLFAGILTFAAKPVKASAASYVRTSRTEKAGKYYIWGDYSTNTLRISTSQSGNGTVLARPASGRHIGIYALSNGSTIYYMETQYYGMYTVGYLYRIKTNKTGKTYLGRVRNAEWPIGYYNGNLYLVCSVDDDPTYLHTYRYNLKTKKGTRVMTNVAPTLTYSKYLVGTPNSGDFSPLPIYIYNYKTNKKVRITKTGATYSRVGKKLYYAEFTNRTVQTINTFRIRSCSFTGKSKKTVVKSLKASYIGKITSSYVYYTKYTSKGYTNYRYNIKTKKSSVVKS